MKKAFTLIELMIVIVIIGVVYTLALSKIKAPEEKTLKEPTLLTLKSYLLDFMGKAEKVSLVCDDECKKCTISQDGKKIKTIQSFLENDVERYRYDFFLGAVALPQQEGCFSFSVQKSGVSDQVFVLYKQKAYDYMNYFEKPKVYDSLEEAVAAKEKIQEALQ